MTLKREAVVEALKLISDIAAEHSENISVNKQGFMDYYNGFEHSEKASEWMIKYRDVLVPILKGNNVSR